MQFSIVTIYTIALALAAQAAGPFYKPYDVKLSEDSFFEQFDLNWKSRWTPSKAMKDDKLMYLGEWEVEESIVLPGIKNDKGLVAKSEAALHGISLKLPEVFENKNKTLVLQYEVKFQNGLNCGGAYIKLLGEEGLKTEMENNIEFSDRSPYVIMFGPDKCGSDNKVHFILKIFDEKTGEFKEHQLKRPPMAKIVQTTSLYTLIIEPNQNFEIRINGDIVRSGNLLDSDDFDILPPKEIVDIFDKKPDSWDVDEFIVDVDDKKPEDWDENEPYLIDDPKASKPDDWDEDAPDQIPDPNDVKPDDWDDDDDGVYIQKLIDNPECLKHGCGKWYMPKIKNPKYKGTWQPKLIKNPEFKGEWKPRLIPNPDYDENLFKPSEVSPIGGLGFEIWTMDRDILFDNIYLGHHVDEAENIGNDTFIPKLKAEHALVLKGDSNIEKPLQLGESEQEYEPSFLMDLFENTLDKIADFLTDLQNFVADVVEKPIETLVQRPGESFFFSSIVVTVFGTIVGFWTMLIKVCGMMINSYFENEQTAYVGPSKKVLETNAKINVEKQKQNIELIKEKKGSTNSKANETNANKR